MDSLWGGVPQGLVEPLLVIEEKVGLETVVSLGETGIALEIYLFVFHRPPEALCKDIIAVAIYIRTLLVEERSPWHP
jgi:hypothetical protein